jgi:hypothetical protein
MLPDEVLLEIFDLCLLVEYYRIQRWIALAHVCRRWRSVVFQSPRRLNLRLLCTPKRRARDTLDIWPPFPLVIRDFDNVLRDNDEPPRADTIITALEHNDRVYQIDLGGLTRYELKHVTDSAAMHKPFPELKYLRLYSIYGELWSILPDSFLGGTAARLRSLILHGVPFPGLPKLLLSATHLVKLEVHNISHSGYIPPEAMATSLSALTSLESFHLGLHFPCPRPRTALESRPPPPLTRSILPSLAIFMFTGASEYLEEILVRIDAPRLSTFHIAFFNQIISDTPPLFRFISRTPTLRAPEKVHIIFGFEAIYVEFPSQTSDYGVLSVKIPCRASEWQLSLASLEQICTSSLPVSTLEDLCICEDRHSRQRPRWQDDIENTLWLGLLRPFVAAKNLYLSTELVPRIAPALQELVGGGTTEVLPVLENIFLEDFRTSGPFRVHKGIESYVSARQLTSHPVVVSPCRFR